MEIVKAASKTNRLVQDEQPRPDRKLVGIYVFTITFIVAGIWVVANDIPILVASASVPKSMTEITSLAGVSEFLLPIVAVLLTPAGLLILAFGSWSGCSWARYAVLGAAASSILIASTGNLPVWALVVAIAAIAYLSLPKVRLYFDPAAIRTRP